MKKKKTLLFLDIAILHESCRELCLLHHVLLLTCSEMSLLTNQIVFLCSGYCDVFSGGPQGIVGSPCTMCSSTTLMIGGGIGIYCEFFKAAHSAGFDNFQAFLWYNQGKWPLEPWKVKKIRLALSVSKHAVVLRWVGHIEHSLITTQTFALQALKLFGFRNISFTDWALLYFNSFKKATSARTRRQNGE